ncbi:MAG: class II aldolase/adducin family protein [Bacteroidetes bacterium]|nr:class II aldolase/adducin family protein [Bacteroidota bacterium]
MIDDGVIKYKQHFTEAEPLPETEIAELNEFRNRLFEMRLIGAYENGIGYGNISVLGKDGIIISGSQTGHIPKLTAEHYVLINQYSIEQNELWCAGPIKASSESLTHAAVYELDPSIKAVIHIHSKTLWDKWLHKYPTTKAEIPYGTPEMANEVSRLYNEGGMNQTPTMLMAGHEEGIITFGKDLGAAFDWIEKL